MTEDELYQQFRLIFEKYYVPLCNYSLSITDRRDVSEDIVQEVFMKVWENRKDLIPSDAVRFYLFAAVRNNSLGHMNKQRRMSTIPFGPKEYVLAEEDAREYETRQKTYRQILEQGIKSLPPKCRDVFLLSRTGKFSYQEIADNCGISVKTVENQVGKALKLLRAFAGVVKWLPVIIFFWKG